MKKLMNKTIIVLFSCLMILVGFSQSEFEISVSKKKTGLFSTLSALYESGVDTIKLVKGVL